MSGEGIFSSTEHLFIGDLAISTQKGNRFLIPFDLTLFRELNYRKKLTLVQQNNSATQNNFQGWILDSRLLKIEIK